MWGEALHFHPCSHGKQSILRDLLGWDILLAWINGKFLQKHEQGNPTINLPIIEVIERDVPLNSTILHLQTIYNFNLLETDYVKDIWEVTPKGPPINSVAIPKFNFSPLPTTYLTLLRKTVQSLLNHLRVLDPNMPLQLLVVQPFTSKPYFATMNLIHRHCCW